MNPLDLVGVRFERLLVVAKLDRTRSGSRWLCQCDCGGSVTKITSQLRRKNAKARACRGCESDTRSRANTEHGGSKQNTVGREKLYQVWKGMLGRCRRPGQKYYAAKGITVCAQWHDYAVFREWAVANGYTYIEGVTRGDRLSIERINPAIGYFPENCEWITGRENSRRMAVSRHKKESA